jgi:hypothetical protein
MRSQFTLVSLVLTLFIALPAAADPFSPAGLDDAGFDPAVEVEVIDPLAPPELVEIEVRFGESLYDIARWSDLDMEDIEVLNGIDLRDGLKGGQTLTLPLDEAAFARLQSERKAFSDSRVDRYLSRRGGLADISTYRMGTGDTVWDVAKANGRLPLWVVSAFNEDLDLDRVGVGATLHLPVPGDAIAVKPAAPHAPAPATPTGH